MGLTGHHDAHARGAAQLAGGRLGQPQPRHAGLPCLGANGPPSDDHGLARAAGEPEPACVLAGELDAERARRAAVGAARDDHAGAQHVLLGLDGRRGQRRREGRAGAGPAARHVAGALLAASACPGAGIGAARRPGRGAAARSAAPGRSADGQGDAGHPHVAVHVDHAHADREAAGVGIGGVGRRADPGAGIDDAVAVEVPLVVVDRAVGVARPGGVEVRARARGHRVRRRRERGDGRDAADHERQGRRRAGALVVDDADRDRPQRPRAEGVARRRAGRRRHGAIAEVPLVVVDRPVGVGCARDGQGHRGVGPRLSRGGLERPGRGRIGDVEGQRRDGRRVRVVGDLDAHGVRSVGGEDRRARRREPAVDLEAVSIGAVREVAVEVPAIARDDAVVVRGARIEQRLTPGDRGRGAQRQRRDGRAAVHGHDRGGLVGGAVGVGHADGDVVSPRVANGTSSSPLDAPGTKSSPSTDHA